MKTQTRPVWSAQSAEVRQPRKSAAQLITLVLMAVLAGLVFWGLDKARPLAPESSYQAPVLELFLMGAAPAGLSFSSLDEFTEANVTSSGFRFTTAEDAAFTFRLEFRGVAEAGGQAFYDLRGGAYPLVLTLLGEGHARTFVAFDGTVSLSEDEGGVAAFFRDEFNEQIFLSARFRRPNASQVQRVSETLSDR